MLLACTGRVVVSGMGKVGPHRRQDRRDPASTGTPAFFLHPAEASHGDLGMVTKGDVVLAISTRQTAELLTILRFQAHGCAAHRDDRQSAFHAFA
jgi:arabinose-5-phosphate isomerase